MKRLGYVLLLLIVIAGTSRAPAQETATCTPSAPTINFGAYDVLAGAVLNGTGSFTVTCTRTNSPNNGQITIAYTAKLLDIVTARQLIPPSGPDRLAYQLYTDAARTQPWGDGTAGWFTITGSFRVRGNGSATDAAKNFYGAITPGGQDVSAASPPPGPTTYSQTFTITVTCTPSPPC
jgi:spore coat protein U-like protein